MLAFFSRTEAILAGPVFYVILPQPQVPYYQGEGAVRDRIAIFFMEDFLNANHITPARFEQLRDDGFDLLVTRGT